ncbi:hypothetical protein ABVT39_008029 [Epinephelus coioides]
MTKGSSICRELGTGFIEDLCNADTVVEDTTSTGGWKMSFLQRRIGRQPRTGGRRTLLSREQEQEICNIVMANNAITLREIRNTIIQDNLIFQNINTISTSTIDRVLKKHEMSMKQLYRVPFERNSDRVKELRFQYVNLATFPVTYKPEVSRSSVFFTVRHEAAERSRCVGEYSRLRRGDECKTPLNCSECNATFPNNYLLIRPPEVIVDVFPALTPGAVSGEKPLVASNNGTNTDVRSLIRDEPTPETAGGGSKPGSEAARRSFTFRQQKGDCC